MDADKLERALAGARAEGRELLLETEGFELLEALGLRVPARRVFRRDEEISAADLEDLPGERVVVKIVAPGVAHKTDLGGVLFVDKRLDRVRSSVDELFSRFGDHHARAVAVYEEIPETGSFGSELLLGLRWNREFGPVLHLGSGGLEAELLGRELRPERSMAAISSELPTTPEAEDRLSGVVAVRALTESRRSRPPRIARVRLDDLLRGLSRVAWELMTGYLEELEINPLVPMSGGFVALDVLARRRTGPRPAPLERPADKIARLLEPRSIGLVGVSRRMNPGRRMLRNILREGFEAERVWVVKPGIEQLDGCACVPDLDALPHPVDLLVVSLAAAEVPDLVGRVIAGRRAESLIVIPGGLEEKSGGETLAAAVRRDLDASRQTPWRGPVVNGGNCLGIRSRPGRYDTLFLPDYKLAPADPDLPARTALISQSGAFLAARCSKLQGIGVKYAISVGNQIDLTLGDYLEHLADDPELDLFAVYAEGFKPLDGLRFLRAAERIRRRGASVVLYRAGRSRAGMAAAASHTAAMAGDYAVTRALAENVGVQVAETLADFEDLVELHGRLGGPGAGAGANDPPPGAVRLGAVSNAGFECVVMGDGFGAFEPAELSTDTRTRLRRIFERARIEDVVDIRNPLDLTPMTSDADFADAVRALLEDDGVDAAVVGCVPLTGALETLPRGEGHAEDLASPGSVVSRLVRLRSESAKPWVAVVDAGRDYDLMASRLRAGGIPTFRTADRALRLFASYCRQLSDARSEAGDDRGRMLSSGRPE